MFFNTKSLILPMIGCFPFLEQISDYCSNRKNTVLIIAYHRVKDYDENSYAFDKGLINATCEEFEWQIRYIKKYFTPLTFFELKEIIESKLDLPKRSIIITFDDGFDDNYNNAFRILNKYSVPATFFITTNMIDSEELFWFEKIYYLLSKTKMKVIKNPSNSIIELSKNRFEIINQVTESLKLESNYKMQAYIKYLEEELNVFFDPAELKDSRAMTWAQVQEMSEFGMEIGSHSRTHPILSMLSGSELKNELILSKNTIEEKINKKIIAFAYPNGDDASINENVEDLVEGAGYYFGLKYGITGINNLPINNMYSLERMGILNKHKKNTFKVALNYASLIRWL